MHPKKVLETSSNLQVSLVGVVMSIAQKVNSHECVIPQRGRKNLRAVAAGFAVLLLFNACSLGKEYTYSEVMFQHGFRQPARPADEQFPHKPDLSSLKGPLSVMEAVRIAFRNNPDISLAIARIRESEAVVDEANAAFWPSLSYYAEYTRADAPSIYLFKKIDQRSLPSGVDFNDPGRIDNYELGLAGSFNVYKGGRDLLRKKMAASGLQMEQLDRLAVENALTASVIHAYYNVLTAQDYVAIAHEALKTVELQLQIMSVQFKGGAVLKSDVLSLEVRLAEAKENAVRAENNYQLSLSALANLLGANPDTPIRLSGEQWKPEDVFPDYRAGVLEALRRRPELLQARQRLVHAAMAVDMEKAGYLPTINAHGKYYYDDSDPGFDRNRANWTAGALMDWNLFSGFGTKSAVERAKAALEQMYAADRKATLAVQLDVKTAYLKLSEANARRAVAQAGVAHAEESFHLVKREYEGGTAVITRYLDAELALNAARMRDVSARYDVKKADADVRRALGYFVSEDPEALDER